MLLKEPPKMPRSDPHAFGKLLQIAAIQRALGNQLERPGNHSPGPEPRGASGRRVWPASSARSKTGRFRSRGGLEPVDALGVAEGHRANGPAVDTRRGDACKETAVKTVVTAVDCLPTKCRVELQVPGGGTLRQPRTGATCDGAFGQNRIPQTSF
jgi:hypothetical protein